MGDSQAVCVMNVHQQPATIIDDRPTLSASALDNYLTCGRKGQFYHDRDLPRRTTIGLALGSGYHHSLETYFLLRKLGEDVDQISPPDLFERAYAIAAGYVREAMAQDDFVWLDHEDPDKETADAVTKLSNMLSTWATNPSYRWTDAQPIGTEVKVQADFGSDSHVFIGFLDLVVEGNFDGPVLIDHKTAGRAYGGAKGAGDPRKLVQAPLYAEAWYQQTGVQPAGFAYDVMTHAGKFQRIWVDVSPGVRQHFVDRWLEMSTTIALHEQAGLNMPTNPDSNLCSPKYCGYWELCPMGAGLTPALA